MIRNTNDVTDDLSLDFNQEKRQGTTLLGDFTPARTSFVTPARTNMSNYQVAQRYKLSVDQDFSTFASSKSKHHRRYFIFGDYEVGKTSLWLRYIFYDQKHA